MQHSLANAMNRNPSPLLNFIREEAIDKGFEMLERALARESVDSEAAHARYDALRGHADHMQPYQKTNLEIAKARLEHAGILNLSGEAASTINISVFPKFLTVEEVIEIQRAFNPSARYSPRNTPELGGIPVPWEEIIQRASKEGHDPIYMARQLRIEPMFDRLETSLNEANNEVDINSVEERLRSLSYEEHSELSILRLRAAIRRFYETKKKVLGLKPQPITSLAMAKKVSKIIGAVHSGLSIQHKEPWAVDPYASHIWARGAESAGIGEDNESAFSLSYKGEYILRWDERSDSRKELYATEGLSLGGDYAVEIQTQDGIFIFWLGSEWDEYSLSGADQEVGLQLIEPNVSDGSAAPPDSSIKEKPSLDMTWLRRLVFRGLQFAMSNPPELLVTAIVSAIEPLMLGKVGWNQLSLVASTGFGAAHTGRSKVFQAFAAGWGLGVMYAFHASPVDFWHTYPIIAAAQFAVNLFLHYAPKQYPNLFNPKIARQYLQAA